MARWYIPVGCFQGHSNDIKGKAMAVFKLNLEGLILCLLTLYWSFMNVGSLKQKLLMKRQYLKFSLSKSLLYSERSNNVIDWKTLKLFFPTFRFLLTRSLLTVSSSNVKQQGWLTEFVELNLHIMPISIVLKFDKDWLTGTQVIDQTRFRLQKNKDTRNDGQGDSSKSVCREGVQKILMFMQF